SGRARRLEPPRHADGRRRAVRGRAQPRDGLRVRRDVRGRLVPHPARRARAGLDDGARAGGREVRADVHAEPRRAGPGRAHRGRRRARRGRDDVAGVDDRRGGRAGPAGHGDHQGALWRQDADERAQGRVRRRRGALRAAGRVGGEDPRRGQRARRDVGRELLTLRRIATMSEPTQQPAFDVRGAVDLSALTRPQSPPPGEEGGAPAAGGYVVDVTEESFGQLVQDSTQYPVVVLLWIPTDQATAQLGTELGALADEYAGRFLLARVDAQTYPQIAAAFQVQGVPTVVAVLQGQPVPLFQGAAPAEQVRAVLDQVLQAAGANGVTGRAPARGGDGEPVAPVGRAAGATGAAGGAPARGGDAEPEAAAAPAPEPEPELPPLHQEAYDAIERDDLDAAVAAYEKAIKQDPRDALAVAGLAQVRLLQRTRDADLAAVRAAAADAPGDVDAQLAIADLDLLGGHVDDALGRLLDLLPGADADAKEKL